MTMTKAHHLPYKQEKLHLVSMKSHLEASIDFLKEFSIQDLPNCLLHNILKYMLPRKYKSTEYKFLKIGVKSIFLKDLSGDFSQEYLITKPLKIKNIITASEPKRNRNPTLIPKRNIFCGSK